jgi:NAD(P)-dependent dehydrogenase (short-subunit alcohol dehydrogenase family)
MRQSSPTRKDDLRSAGRRSCDDPHLAIHRIKIADTSAAEWRRALSINLDGAFHISQRVLPGIRKAGFGRIVNTCSLAMKTGGLTAGTAYSVSKGALGALTFSLARETARQGITVNGIAPAYVRAPIMEEQLTKAQRQALLLQVPVGRFCEPEEIVAKLRQVDVLVSQGRSVERRSRVETSLSHTADVRSSRSCSRSRDGI